MGSLVNFNINMTDNTLFEKKKKKKSKAMILKKITLVMLYI